MSINMNVPTLRFSEFSESWEEVKLGDISKDTMYGMNSAAVKFNGQHKYIRITDIDEDSRRFLPKPLSSPEGNIETKFKLKENDILFARTGASVGKSYIYKKEDGDLYFAGFLIKLNIDKANSYFVYSNTFRGFYNKWVKTMSVRSGQPGINAQEYKLLPICLPSKQEQKKIASFLISIDRKIEQFTKKETLLQEYKKGVMQKIFSQEIRFKEDDGGDYPEWEEKKLGEVGSVITGKTPSTSKLELWNGNIQFITPTDINNGKYQDKTSRTVTEQLKMKILPKGSIVYTCIASIGKMSLTTLPSITNQQINSIVVSKINNNEFVYYLLLKLTPYIQSTQANTTLPIINKTEFSRLKIKLPCLKEQTKIANFLSSIDKKIESVSQQLNQTKEFKKALLQQMFV